MPTSFAPDQVLTVRVSVEEMAMLTLLADKEGSDIEAVLRSSIRRAYEERFQETGVEA